MKFIEQIERLKKMHKLILDENTGAPDEFADKLGVSRRQLYNLLKNLKNYGAPLKYSKKKICFYYTSSFDIELEYSFKVITKENQC